MPSLDTVPFPGQVNIQRADWGSPVGNGMGQAAATIGSPINPINAAQQFANDQATNQAKQAQTANALQEVMGKQRQFQLSMLNGVLALPEEQQADALAKVVPMMNRMGPTQYSEDMTPATAKMITMANVPTEQIPQFQMMQSQAGMLNALRDRLAGNVQHPNGGAPSQAGISGTPMPQNGVTGNAPDGTPMPQNGIIGGAAPIPAGGGTPLDTDTLNLMAVVKPDTANAMTNVQKLQFESPQGKGAIAGAETQAKNTTEAQKNALESSEGYQQVAKTIDALKSMIGTVDDKGNVTPNPDLPQSSYGIPAKGQAWWSQNFGNQKESDAYNTFQTLNESQTINAIRDLASTGQIKMTRTLENIINRGYLIDPDVSPKAKIQQADAIKTELQNSAAAAQNVASKMSGGQGNTPYQAPYTAPQSQQSTQNGLPHLVPGQTVYKGHLYMGGDPSKPEAWQVQGAK